MTALSYVSATIDGWLYRPTREDTGVVSVVHGREDLTTLWEVARAREFARASVQSNSGGRFRTISARESG